MLYHTVSIGSVVLPGNLFLAPVAGYSDRAFRSVCRAGGANFTYTEMVSAEALVRGSDKTKLLMARALNETQYAVQLFGGNPEVVSKAVDLILSGKLSKDIPEVIDINAGCPVPKIVKTGAGSALTREPKRLYEITKAAVQAVEKNNKNIPVTVKIRSGWDSSCITWKEAATAAIEAGAQAITLHGRTRAQGYEGFADWQVLSDLVFFVADKTGGKIPVFGSGDVFSPKAAKEMLEQTGCSAVMFARGAMGNPFVFVQTQQLLTQGYFEEIPPAKRILAGMEELECLICDNGEFSACKQMRKRFCAYSKGVPGGAELRSAIISANTKKDYINLFSNAGLLNLQNMDSIKVT